MGNRLHRFFFLVKRKGFALIGRLIPKSTQIWVFGSWFGERYADNSRALFEYVQRERPDIKAIWLTREKTVIDRVRRNGGHAFISYGLRGSWWVARAKCGFVTSSYSDIHRHLRPAVVVNLWHGIPLKTVMHADARFRSSREALSPRASWYIAQLADDLHTDICVSSPIEAEVMARSFKLSRRQVHITGSPRTDALWRSLQGAAAHAEGLRALYAPTFRGDGTDEAPEWLSADQLRALDLC